MIYHPTIGGSTAIATAISQGYFEEENLTVNLQMYTSGPPEIAAMVAKQADVGCIGSGAAWLAFSGQVNIIALDNIALTEEIITRADNGINSIADLKGKTVAVIGFGSQGHAHALNLKESGVDVVVGLYDGSKSWKHAESVGLKVMTTAEAAKAADIIMILTPDEKQT